MCVPIDPKSCEEFDPTSVPTLSKVSMCLTDVYLSQIYILIHLPFIILACMLAKTILSPCCLVDSPNEIILPFVFQMFNKIYWFSEYISV